MKHKQEASYGKERCQRNKNFKPPLLYEGEVAHLWCAGGVARPVCISSSTLVSPEHLPCGSHGNQTLAYPWGPNEYKRRSAEAERLFSSNEFR